MIWQLLGLTESTIDFQDQREANIFIVIHSSGLFVSLRSSERNEQKNFWCILRESQRGKNRNRYESRADENVATGYNKHTFTLCTFCILESSGEMVDLIINWEVESKINPRSSEFTSCFRPCGYANH